MATTGPDHYRRSEQLLKEADDQYKTELERSRLLAEAQVHATLALVAANVYGGGFSEKDVGRWRDKGVFLD